MPRLAILLAVALVAAGPARAQSGTGTGPVLAFTVTDSALRGPASFPAGVVTVQLANRGRGVHQFTLLQIGPGHTVDEARAFVLANDGPPPWSRLTLGIGPVEGGRTLTVTLKLDPGSYLLVDLLPDARGRPNYRAGVTAPLTGTGTARRELANIPAASGLVLSNRFRFGNLIRSGNTWTQSESRDRSTGIPRGPQTIRLESFASGFHSVVLSRGGPEVMRQYVDWRAGRRPTPPAGLLGGVSGMANQVRAFLQLRLEPGGYIFFCPDATPSGLIGFEAGEYTQFSVR